MVSKVMKGVFGVKVLISRLFAIGSMVAMLYVANVTFLGDLNGSSFARFSILVPMFSILLFVGGLFILFFKPSKSNEGSVELLSGEDALVVALVYIIFCIGFIVLLEPTWFIDKVIILEVF